MDYTGINSINRKVSTPQSHDFLCGVPQGYVLGPVIFSHAYLKFSLDYTDLTYKYLDEC